MGGIALPYFKTLYSCSNHVCGIGKRLDTKSLEKNREPHVQIHIGMSYCLLLKVQNKFCRRKIAFSKQYQEHFCKINKILQNESIKISHFIYNYLKMNHNLHIKCKFINSGKKQMTVLGSMSRQEFIDLIPKEHTKELIN